MWFRASRHGGAATLLGSARDYTDGPARAASEVQTTMNSATLFTGPLAPMLAKLAPALPDGEGWLYEPKWDGLRAIAFHDAAGLRLQGRDLKSLNAQFPELV